MKTAKKVKTITKIAVREAVAAVGIDLGDRWSHWCALSPTGEVIERGRVKTAAEDLSELAAGWSGVRVAIENGTHSGWISRTLEKSGCLVWVANPSRWRGTAHSSKNDANDAEALARVVRVDPKLLCPITAPHPTAAGRPCSHPCPSSAREGKNHAGEHCTRCGQECRSSSPSHRCRRIPQHQLAVRTGGIAKR